MELANECARIKVSVDESGQGRLRIHSVMLNRTVFLDPLELELLIWSDRETMRALISTPCGPEGDFADSLK